MKTKIPKQKLSKEITACLIIKILLLTLIWSICFNHPVAEHTVTKQIAKMFTPATHLSLGGLHV